MKKHETITWAPRILSILFAGFISLFAMDVFGEYSGLGVLIALFMHLIPTFIIIGILLVAWRRPLVGTIAYLLLAGVYLIMMRGNVDLISFLLIGGPLFIIAGLFYWDYRNRK